MRHPDKFGLAARPQYLPNDFAIQISEQHNILFEIPDPRQCIINKEVHTGMRLPQLLDRERCTGLSNPLVDRFQTLIDRRRDFDISLQKCGRLSHHIRLFCRTRLTITLILCQ